MNTGKYLCFEHGVHYTDDDMMCPQCEKEICETHDNQMEKDMTDKFVPSNTTHIQEESLTNFMAALGYEPVYSSYNVNLLRFSQPRFAKHGQAIVSVNRAIRMHNSAGEESFAELIAFTKPQELREYLRDFKNYQTITNVAAGSTKIVEQIKGSFSKKKGFIVHDHNIKFMTNRDKRKYSDMIGW